MCQHILLQEHFDSLMEGINFDRDGDMRRMRILLSRLPDVPNLLERRFEERVAQAEHLSVSQEGD